MHDYKIAATKYKDTARQLIIETPYGAAEIEDVIDQLSYKMNLPVVHIRSVLRTAFQHVCKQGNKHLPEHRFQTDSCRRPRQPRKMPLSKLCPSPKTKKPKMKSKIVTRRSKAKSGSRCPSPKRKPQPKIKSSKRSMPVCPTRCPYHGASGSAPKRSRMRCGTR